MIHDARHLFGCETEAEIRGYWQGVLDQQNKRRLPADRLVLTDDDRTPAAYVNHGRWVADCPNCGDGIACWAAMDRSACLGCGHAYVIAYPLAQEQRAAAALLAERPDRRNRNWTPGQESIDRLHTENTLLLDTGL